MTLIHFLFRHSGKLLLLATLASLISGLSGAALIGLISKAVMLSNVEASAAGIFFLTCLVYVATKSASEITLLHLTQNAVLGLRVSLSHKLLATPLKKLQSLGKDGLLVIVTRDVDTFTTAFQMLPLAFGNGIVIAACLGYMAWISWQIFAAFTICLLGALFVFHFVERRPLGQLIVVREQLSILYKNFRSLIEGSKELQLNARRGSRFVDEVIAPAALRYKTLFTSTMTHYTWVQNIGMIIFYLVIGTLVFIVPIAFPQKNGVLITVTFILLYLIRPISEMMSILPVLRQATVALHKIQELENTLASLQPAELQSDPFAGKTPITLTMRDVCHHYSTDNDERTFMMGPLNLTVDQGELLFIVGGNGSGKTTLAMLLLGLYEAEHGTLQLNNVIVTPENRVAYRQHFSAVFADFHLFEQLLVSEQSHLEGRAEQYVELLRMAHKVKITNGAFSTVDLSTGQRKRLALIASYLEDRPIYLFDEWAADQDPVFKRVFYTELLPELKARGKTVIVITHDDAYFDCADRIIKLQDGRLIETTHHEDPISMKTFTSETRVA